MIQANLPSDFTIGIIGGGQLGRMFIENALRYNVKCAVLEASEDCPAAKVADKFILGKLTDAAAIRKLAEVSDVLTYEIEHINVAALEELEAEGKTIIPSPKVLRVIQDKGVQKRFYQDNGLPTSAFSIVKSPREWMQALDALELEDRFVAKKCRGGYDGQGVAIMKRQQLADHPDQFPFTDDTVIEAFVPCDKELAVMVCRDLHGNVEVFPTVEMEFDPEANLVTFLNCPARIDETIAQQAEAIARQAVERLNGYGIFAIELFLDHQGELYINEMAPRPHNSGHHTIEACYSSQYDQLLRILCGLPLGNAQLRQPGVMINILGALEVHGPYHLDGIQEALQESGVYIHLYEKKETRPMRKLGHVTVVDDTLEATRAKARRVRDLLKIVPAQPLIA